MNKTLRIVSCVDPMNSRYRIACEACGLVSVWLMHGEIECRHCHIKATAHDMLIEYQKREQFLDSVTGFTSPASAQANATVKTPGAGD